ncbi:hypothetical protein TRFO_32857 [Tritrichomonas foetus]|uniref:EF-hand domain-containing protein n=1 Tax=Tritrichomonas foetus TaxID=1144522 RepID=A0A1J4JSE4_9EUKA|nr:hypothetical protein TRFO_32857 [Tritrichomonas foetus]|eukprot:OHT00452.1 hypothetical protein TRFO_32857 [Tritrichomonas foetus]
MKKWYQSSEKIIHTNKTLVKIMSEGYDLADKFYGAVRRKGLTPIELFEEYDRTGKGTISLDSFEKLLRSISFYCSRDEMELIKNSYCLTDGRSEKFALLDYQKFCNDIGPNGKLTLSRTSSLNKANFYKFAQELEKNGATIYDYMKGFDSKHSGKVLLPVFLQAVGSSELVNSIIGPYYNRSTNEVNYVQMQRDLDHAEVVKEEPKVTLQLPSFFEQFVRTVHARSDNLLDEFRLKDHLKHGKLSKTMFLSIIGSLKLPFNHQQLQQIMIPFVDGDDVNYLLFCKEFDKLVPRKEFVEYDFSSPLEPLLESIKLQASSRRLHLYEEMSGKVEYDTFFRILSNHKIKFTPNDREALHKAFLLPDNTFDADAFIEKVDPIPHHSLTTANLCIERLRNYLQETNKSLVSYFVNFDRERSNTITSNQLHSALISIGFPVNKLEVQLISQQFGNGTFLNYKDLCEQVESKQLSSFNKSVFIPPETPFNERIRVILAKIYTIAKQYNVDLHSDFLRADPRRRGTLSTQLFRNILCEIPIPVSSNDICELIENYTDPYIHLIYYDKFSTDLELIGSSIKLDHPYFTRRKIDPEPEPDTKQISYIDSIRNQILMTLKRCAVAARSERLTMSDMFRRFDNSEIGYVPVEEAKAILRPIDHCFDDQAYDELIQYFHDPRMPEKFNWKKLDAAVESTDINEEDIQKINQMARTKLNLDKDMNSVYNTIRARLTARRKRIDDIFLDVLQNSLTETEFRQRLDRTNLFLDEFMIKSIIHTHEDENGKIKWKEFCDCVTNSNPFNYSY